MDEGEEGLAVIERGLRNGDATCGSAVLAHFSNLKLEGKR